MTRKVTEQVKIDFASHTFQHVVLTKPIEVVIVSPERKK